MQLALHTGGMEWGLTLVCLHPARSSRRLLVLTPPFPCPSPPALQLLEGVCKEGVRAVESQQAAAAALSAAVAAAGTLMIRAGIF